MRKICSLLYISHFLPFRPHLRGGNGMEMNEKNNFRIFSPSLIQEFKWERMKWIGENTQASFGWREWNGMEMNEKNNFRIFFPSFVWEF